MQILDPKTISELNRAFTKSPQGFLVVDSGKPQFAVLPFTEYQSMKEIERPKGRPKTVLVTGGAGYIGSHTVRVLEKLGHEVVVFDNLSTGRRETVRDAEFIKGDLKDRAALDKVFAEHNIDVVVHFAASIEVEESVMDPAKYFQNNVVNGLNLLDAMVEAGVSKIVFSSTAAVYGEPERTPIREGAVCRPTNPYGLSKLMFEEILKEYEKAYGLHSVSLRYFNAGGAWPEEDLGYPLTGGNTHLIPRVLDAAAGRSSEIEVFGQDYNTQDGSAIRDYIHILDLADAHVLALKKLEHANGSYVYNVGTGQGHTVLEVIDEAVEITGRMIPMKVAGRRAGDPEKLFADCSKIKNEFGWQPKHSLKEILQSSWQWHQRASGN